MSILDDDYEDKLGTKPDAESDKAQYGDPEDEDSAKLLSLPGPEAAALNYRLWKDQPKGPISRRRAQWKVNEWRREGRTNVFVQKTQDQDRWQAWSPPWNAPPVPVLNKADRLCRRLKAMVWADPPQPEAIPENGSDEAIEAAEFIERVLSNVQGEGQLDDLRTASRAFDRGSTNGCGFIRYFLDAKGGGRQPVRIMAKPGALTADQPFTGPNGEPLEGDVVGRYAKEDGTLTDDPAEAATQWMPALDKEIVEAPNVRFLPHDSEDLWDADGVIIATMPTWGELLELWPEEMAKLSEDDIAAILSFKPEHHRDLMGDGRSGNDTATRREDKPVAVFTTYYTAGPGYPKGCYFVGLGDRVALYRQKWVAEVDGVEEALDIPLTQYMQFEAGRREPYGVGLMELLGGGNEIRAAQVGHLMSHLDQFSNRRTFVPTNSIIQPRQYQLMQGSVIPVNPGGEPKFEEIPAYPRESMDLFTLMTDEMNDQSMMQETAQGTEVSSVTSGKQAQVVVAQAKAGLSDVQQNTERAYIRACRIQAQLIRTGYTVPQQIAWQGDDGQYRQKYWTGSDLKGVKDFKLKRGSLTMMTNAEKVNMAFQFQGQGVYASHPEAFYDTIVGEIGADVGLQDDPFRQRIKRQLSAWSEGPPEGWQPPQAPMQLDPVTGTPTGQPMVDPQTGQTAPPPSDPHLQAIFGPLPADELQDVATVRLTELKRFMATTRFTRWSAEWRQGVVGEFEHMKQAAGVMTIAEQQAAQQAAAQQRQQAETQKSQADFQRDVAKEQIKKAAPARRYQVHSETTGRAYTVESTPVIDSVPSSDAASPASGALN